MLSLFTFNSWPRAFLWKWFNDSNDEDKKKKSFTPASRRQLIPDAIAWFIKYYPDLTDAQIIKLIGTTKNTIKSIKNREHWNMQNISPRDPVLLALCKQSELTEAIAVTKKKAMKNKWTLKIFRTNVLALEPWS